ncbi:MAG: ABC transporter permease [Caldilineaceae bacterium]|nr:ABC transporter permease [Caldilineaceae bacterium]
MAIKVHNPTQTQLQRPETNLWADALRRLSRNKAAVVSAIFLFLLVLVALFAPLLAPYSPYEPDFSQVRMLPSADHWLGTDELGRDILSRLMYGARVSLFVGITVQTAATFIGIAVGLLAGYYSGFVDIVLMRAVDIMYAFPNFLFAVFMVSLLEPSVGSVILTLSLASWPFVARLVRGQALSTKNMEYIMAARVIGTPNRVIMRRHILPNILSPIIIQFTLGIAGVIMAEAALSFLGIGIRPPNPTWGGMISKGREFFRTSPHLAIYPSIILGLTMIAFNFLGDGLRDALDPRMKR